MHPSLTCHDFQKVLQTLPGPHLPPLRYAAIILVPCCTLYLLKHPQPNEKYPGRHCAMPPSYEALQPSKECFVLFKSNQNARKLLPCPLPPPERAGAVPKFLSL